MDNFDLSEFEVRLPESTSSQRQEWAKQILEKHIDLPALIDYFLTRQEAVLSRFLWLLSDLGTLAPDTLLAVLPQLLNNFESINILNINSTFANYWLIAGVPEENEAEVINILFDWINSPQSNITAKSRAILVIQKRLIKKYPELKPEFKLHLENQLNRHTSAYQLKIRKVIKDIS